MAYFAILLWIFNYKGPGIPGGTEIKWETSAAGLCWWCDLLGDNIDTIKKNTQTLTDTSKDAGLEVKTKLN
jgi:hypothetical protein